MNSSAVAVIAMAAGAVAALGVFALYRWQQRKRVRRVGGWVRDYLSARYGELPNPLTINCSDDRLWPVLVGFDDPQTGARHRLQFACPGPHATFALLSEQVDQR
jgi:hypothetical protein